MAKRDELYRQFGPLLLEAVVSTFTDYINPLRAKANLPPVTPNDVMTKIEEKLQGHDPYDWMTTEPP